MNKSNRWSEDTKKKVKRKEKNGKKERQGYYEKKFRGTAMCAINERALNLNK